MTGGIDPAFEVTQQESWITGDSGLVIADTVPRIVLATVPAGQMWLVERIAVIYRPGEVPTRRVYFTLSANDVDPVYTREGTEILPSSGVFVAGQRYLAFADEASPVRFFANEQILATAPLFGSATHKGRLIVNVQYRATQKLGGAKAPQPETQQIPPVAPMDDVPPHEPAWN